MMPDGVAPTITDRDFTVATIAAPTVHVEEEVGEGEEGVEGAEDTAAEEGGGEAQKDDSEGSDS